MEQPKSTKRTFSLAVSLPIILVQLVAAPLAVWHVNIPTTGTRRRSYFSCEK